MLLYFDSKEAVKGKINLLRHFALICRCTGFCSQLFGVGMLFSCRNCVSRWDMYDDLYNNGHVQGFCKLILLIKVA